MTKQALKRAAAQHKERKAREDAAARIERKAVSQDYWIEAARGDERDMGPYRMCTTGGQRFALSINEAKRAMLEGLTFKMLDRDGNLR